MINYVSTSCPFCVSTAYSGYGKSRPAAVIATAHIGKYGRVLSGSDPVCCVMQSSPTPQACDLAKDGANSSTYLCVSGTAKKSNAASIVVLNNVTTDDEVQSLCCVSMSGRCL